MIQQCVARGWSCASRRALDVGAVRRSVGRSAVPWRRTLAAQVDVTDAPPARDVSEKVAKIANEILELNLMEISDLSSVLKERLGLDALPMGGMMPMAAAPAAAAAAPGAEAAEAPAAAEKTAFDVKLESFDSGAKIKVIKEVRAFMELGLKEAKDKVEQAPVLLKEGVDKKTAEEIKKKLEEVGGVVSLS